jgi:aspartate racemase
MKTIGLIGGMSWESTVVYYQLLNQLAREKLGGLNSAKVLLWSFNFREIEDLQSIGDWQSATEKMCHAAQSLKKGGADCIVICTNTMHKMANEVERASGLPLIHIADATASAINQSSSTSPLLLATQYTMEQDFYKGRLLEKHHIAVKTPQHEDRMVIHNIIYEELCQGKILAESKATYLSVIERCQRAGSDGVILGCTEIGLLIGQSDLLIPVFDTTVLHAKAALDFALR